MLEEIKLEEIWGNKLDNKMDEIFKELCLDENDDFERRKILSKLASKHNRLSIEDKLVLDDPVFLRKMELSDNKSVTVKELKNEIFKKLTTFSFDKNAKFMSNSVLDLSSSLMPHNQSLKGLPESVTDLSSFFKDKESGDKLHNSRKLERLAGVNYFVYFKDINHGGLNKRLLLIGENTSEGGSCDDDFSPVHKWLYELAKNAPVCLDLFVEAKIKGLDAKVSNGLEDNDFIDSSETMMKHAEKDLNKYQSGINAIASTFNQCDIRTHAECPIEKLRYHLIDARYFKNNISPMVVLFKEKIKILGGTGDQSEKDQLEENYDAAERFAKNHFKTLLHYFMGFKDDEENRTIFEEYIRIHTKGILLEIPDIEGYMAEYLKLIKKQIKKNKSFNDNKDKKIKNFYNRLFKVYENRRNETTIFKILLAIPMDVYFLLRYLHRYDDNKNRVIGCDSDTAYNSIVYASAEHLKTYTEYFKELNFKPEIKKIHENTGRCMTLDDEFDFFDGL